MAFNFIFFRFNLFGVFSLLGFRALTARSFEDF